MLHNLEIRVEFLKRPVTTFHIYFIIINPSRTKVKFKLPSFSGLKSQYLGNLLTVSSFLKTMEMTILSTQLKVSEKQRLPSDCLRIVPSRVVPSHLFRGQSDHLWWEKILRLQDPEYYLFHYRWFFLTSTVSTRLEISVFVKDKLH